MQFKLTIRCDNAAFGEGHGIPCANEVRRILADLAESLDGQWTYRGIGLIGLYDINGNHVGDATFVGARGKRVRR